VCVCTQLSKVQVAELMEASLDRQRGIVGECAAKGALSQMLGVFAEFERSTIQERVRAGLRRARDEGEGPAGRSPAPIRLCPRMGVHALL
jgi:DNA invertase Pin-like site-specific DNA recombinase